MSDLWFPCHANLAEKEVAKRLARAFRIDVAQAVGHLALMWGAFARYIDRLPSGDLSQITDDELEQWAKWTGTPGSFARHIRRYHTRDGRHINEWDAYVGRLEKQRAQTRERVQRHRDKIKEMRESTAPLASPSVPSRTTLLSLPARRGDAGNGRRGHG